MEFTLGEETITTFKQALERTSAIAHAKLPRDLHGALERATALVAHRRVWLDEDGKHAQVLAADGQTWYHVNGHCTCMEASTLPQGLCPHRLAVGLYRRASELLHAAPATPAAAAALPEAPASANARVLIGGHEVQLTLRDTDDERLLVRLATLLARYPAAPCAGKGTRVPASAAPQTTSETPTCPHHGPGKESTKAPGTWYCTKRMADNSYCQWRHPANELPHPPGRPRGAPSPPAPGGARRGR